MGTPSYMSPEQARSQADLVGEASDVHALGAVIYQMLTGRPPSGNDRAVSVLARLLGEEPPPPRAADRRIPRDLETICLEDACQGIPPGGTHRWRLCSKI